MFVLIVTAWKTNPSLPYPIKRSSTQIHTCNLNSNFLMPILIERTSEFLAKANAHSDSIFFVRPLPLTPHSFRTAHSLHERCLHLILEAQHRRRHHRHTKPHTHTHYDTLPNIWTMSSEHPNLFEKRSAKMAWQFLLACRAVPVFYPQIHIYVIYTSTSTLMLPLLLYAHLTQKGFSI